MNAANNPKAEDDSDDYFLRGSKVTKGILEWLSVLETAESSQPLAKTILIQGAPGMGKSFLLHFYGLPKRCSLQVSCFS